VENYEEKEKIVKVEDMGVDDAGSTRIHNMLLDIVQYNNIETHKDIKIYIYFEGIISTMYIPTTNFEGIYMDTLKFTLRKTWKSVLVCCKKFHFQQNF